jgi:hypothetical protein
VSDHRQSPAVQPVAKMPGPSIEAHNPLVKVSHFMCVGRHVHVVLTVRA